MKTFKVVTRTKAPMRGLGDAVAAVTKATGIAHLTHAAAELLGVDCRCDQRREWLNEAVPFKPALTSGPSVDGRDTD